MPDPDELNAAIPESEWGTDLTGNPRPPWKTAYIVYMIHPENGRSFTYLNDTAGARIAWRKLASQIRNMHMLRGGNWAPFVELSARPMKTGFGVKMRPAFTVTDDWRELGGMPAVLPPPNGGGTGGAAAQIEDKSKSKDKSKAKLDLKDKVPF
jgi:hypothetical protein